MLWCWAHARLALRITAVSPSGHTKGHAPGGALLSRVGWRAFTGQVPGLARGAPVGKAGLPSAQ